MEMRVVTKVAEEPGRGQGCTEGQKVERCGLAVKFPESSCSESLVPSGAVSRGGPLEDGWIMRALAASVG